MRKSRVIVAMVLMGMISFSCAAPGEQQSGSPVELGKVTWLRDYDKAVQKAKDTNQPILLLFQEVPG